ncbi:MAG TPA: terpene synthase family protein [Micromonospora sp.]
MCATRTGSDELSVASEQGRICALAARGQRDLRERADAHRGLFPAKPFDPALFSTVSLATAFGAPWCTAEQLRMSNRAALWVFGADWQVDYLAVEPAQVERMVQGCLAVADGATPAADDQLGWFLAEIRDELATAAGVGTLWPAWRTELRRMLTAMSREWAWKTAHRRAGAVALPTLDDYLDNADNFGSSWVNVSHWIYTAEPAELDELPRLTVAGRAVQRVLRLVNDLATYDRDVSWGDLNALMLVGDRSELVERIGTQVAEARELFEPLRGNCPRQVAYLSRQIGFSSGFYQLTDFWGGL